MRWALSYEKKNAEFVRTRICNTEVLSCFDVELFRKRFIYFTDWQKGRELSVTTTATQKTEKSQPQAAAAVRCCCCGTLLHTIRSGTYCSCSYWLIGCCWLFYCIRHRIKTENIESKDWDREHWDESVVGCRLVDSSLLAWLFLLFYFLLRVLFVSCFALAFIYSYIFLMF